MERLCTSMDFSFCTCEMRKDQKQDVRLRRAAERSEPLSEPSSEPHRPDASRRSHQVKSCERRHDNRDRRHDDSSESSSAGQFRQRRPDNAIRRRLDFMSKAKSCFNILLNILQPSYIVVIFLRTVFSIIILQTAFFSAYTILKMTYN